jgi:AcrR family transcriptional regulator
MGSVKGEPSAKAPSRTERALATRRRMMAAAYRVFSERGYAKTTMEAVATDAGVAVQTLYFTFHTKAELLQAAYEYAVLGADLTPPHLMDWWRAAEAEPDVTRAVGRFVDGSVEIFERAASLAWAVGGDQDARSAYQFNENLRLEGNANMVAVLARKHPLRPGLTQPKARDIMLTLLGPHVFILFTRELGWTVRRYRSWAKGALLRELFALEAQAPRQSAR